MVRALCGPVVVGLLGVVVAVVKGQEGMVCFYSDRYDIL
jgi:hypothetical protein